MIVPSRFLRLELLSVRSRDQLDPNYIKLPPDTCYPLPKIVSVD